MEEASELLSTAANYFRLGKDFQASAACYVRCAEISEATEAAKHYESAGNAIKQISTTDAINYFNKAAEILAGSGRISTAAKTRKTIGEMYEQEEQLDIAAEQYRMSAELFEMDNSDSSSNTCWLKSAELSTLNDSTPDIVVAAIRCFEQVAQRYLSHNLTKYSAKDCYFKACLLHLSNDDPVGSENAINQYANRDPSFETSRECKLIQDLMAATNANDVEGFENAIFAFNKMTPLDRWKTNVCLRAKGFVTGQASLDLR